MQNAFDVKQLLVFSDDWGRHPSSCQHLIRELLPRHKVTWVNTIAMRPPRIDLLTARRAAGKLLQWCTPGSSASTESLPDGLTVKNPMMWPWMHSRSTRALNRLLLTRQLKSDARDRTIITTLPITADLVGRLPAKRWVYYCVDDFSVWPGLSGEILHEMENELIKKVDCVIAVSDHLVDSIRPHTPNVHLLTHGVDLDFWHCDQPTHQTGEPVALFWGVVDQRMEADWLLALADTMQSGKIVLAGPQQDPDPRLMEHSNIDGIGPVPITDLPRMAAAAQVLIMPYADLPVTRAMQPLKFKEYMATGRPVVTSNLPAVRPWSECVNIANSEVEFVNLTLSYLQGSQGNAIDQQLLQAQLKSEAWEQKASEFRNLLSSE